MLKQSCLYLDFDDTHTNSVQTNALLFLYFGIYIKRQQSTF